MADPDHVAIVRKGAAAVGRWKLFHPRESLDLIHADFTKADLKLIDLSGADLSGANLSGAFLFGAKLSGAYLRGTDLSGACLAGAILRDANLFRTNLSGADLSGAFLWGINFSETYLHSTELTNAVLRSANIANCDLSQAKGLDAVEHSAPSSIGIDTLIRSFRGAGNRLTPELKIFFTNAGVPKELLDALPSIVAEVKYYSAFIAYGEPDVGFARELKNDLVGRGVQCWLYSTDHTVGERTWKEITEERRGAEKMIVLCSVKSLIRDGLLKEVEEQMGEDPDKMVPVSLDALWQETGFLVQRAGRDLKPFLLDKNYANFHSESVFEESLESLLKGLRRKE